LTSSPVRRADPISDSVEFFLYSGDIVIHLAPHRNETVLASTLLRGSRVESRRGDISISLESSSITMLSDHDFHIRMSLYEHTSLLDAVQSAAFSSSGFDFILGRSQTHIPVKNIGLSMHVRVHA
jgi:hypothetical protein